MNDPAPSPVSGAVARRGSLTRPLLLYEDRCPFCRAAARLVARLDTHERLSILPFDDPEAAEHTVFLTESQLKDSWQLIETDGTRLVKGRALVRLLGLLPALAWLGRVLSSLHLYALAGVVDQAISKSRPFLSRLVRDAPGPRRPPVR